MLLSLNVLFLGSLLGLLVVIDATPVKLHEAISKLIETSYNQGLRSGANNRLAFPSYDGINKIPIKIEYDFPAQISAPASAPVAVAAPAPVAYAAPSPVQIAAAPVHAVPHAFETRVHYAETPVVVGHTSHIMKPNLGAGAHVTNFDDMGLAQTKNSAPELIAQKSQILAVGSVLTVSELTPQVTVQHRTKVNVEKFAVVPAAVPVAATTFVRAPAHFSAIIKSDRLGGNFAYSVAEGHAYAAITPVVQRVLTPVGVSHHAVATPNFGYPPIEKFAVEVPVAAPYAQPVPVLVAPQVPQYEIHLGAGVFDDSMGLAQTKNAAPLSISAPAPAPVEIDVEWQADGRQSSLDSQFTGDHLPTPPPMPEHRLIKKITNILLRSHSIPDGSLVFVKVAEPVSPNVRRSVSQKIAADSNESLESEGSNEVEESDSLPRQYHLPTPPPPPPVDVVEMLTDLEAANLL